MLTSKKKNPDAAEFFYKKRKDFLSLVAFFTFLDFLVDKMRKQKRH